MTSALNKKDLYMRFKRMHTPNEYQMDEKEQIWDAHTENI